MKFNFIQYYRRHKNFLYAFALSLLTYVVFYGAFLSPNYNFWSSIDQVTDAQAKHLPARTYLYEKITHEHVFPFWTEKMYSGFPVYADPENAFLNPINIVSVLIFGPLESYKVLHLLEYLVGSLSFFILLKRKGLGILAFFTANTIFYFNTFFIDHQIHYNMVMTLLLLPTAVLFADLFFEKKALRFIVLESLVIANGVLWGHMQSVAMILMAVFAYAAVMSYKKIRLITFLFFFAVLTALVAAETLPQFIPTYELLHQSSRGQGTDYLKGSLNPRMVIFAFTPYLFGEYNYFAGRDISNDFSYNEIYFYCGISTFILSVLALLFLKKTRILIAAYSFIWIFLIFGFLESNHLFPKGTPLISLFREWERTAILFAFGSAILAAMFIEKIKECAIKNLKTGWFLVFLPLAYILLLIALNSGKIARKVGAYVSLNHIQAYPFFPLIATISISIAGLLIFLFTIKKYRALFFQGIIAPMQLLLVGLIFFDILFFSRDVLNVRLQNISAFHTATIPAEFESKRVILRNYNILGMESLYYPNWSPFGTSQLKDNTYVDFLGDLGLDLRGITSSIIAMPKDYQSLDKAGIVAVSENEGITYINDRKLDLIKNKINGTYLKKQEGDIVMKLDNPSDNKIDTFMRYNKYWKVTVDGKKVNYDKNGIYLSFPLRQGDHEVEIKYYPWPFYFGIFGSIIILSILVTSYRYYQKQIHSFILK